MIVASIGVIALIASVVGPIFWPGIAIGTFLVLLGVGIGPDWGRGRS